MCDVVCCCGALSERENGGRGSSRLVNVCCGDGEAFLLVAGRFLTGELQGLLQKIWFEGDVLFVLELSGQLAWRVCTELLLEMRRKWIEFLCS